MARLGVPVGLKSAIDAIRKTCHGKVETSILDHIFRREFSVWSSVLGDSDHPKVRPRLDLLELLLLVLRGVQIPPHLVAGSRKGLDETALAAWARTKLSEEKRSVEEASRTLASPTAFMLEIPPTIDALVLASASREQLPESRTRRQRVPRKGVGANMAGLGVDAEIRVSRPRYVDLVGSPPVRAKDRSRLFYLSWKRVLDAQMELGKAGDDDLLVLNAWVMITSPAYCLVRQERPRYRGATHMKYLLAETAPSDQKAFEARKLAEWLRASTIVATRNTTSFLAFERQFEQLKDAGLLDKAHEIYQVTFMSPLMELLIKGALPHDWVIVGGPPQYWAAQENRLAVLYATNENASEITSEDRDSHYLIATRRRLLRPEDRDGTRVAEHIRHLSQELRQGFHHPDADARRGFRTELARRIHSNYQAEAEEPASMTADGVLRYLDQGMELRCGPEGGFVPLREFAPSKSQASRHLPTVGASEIPALATERSSATDHMSAGS